MKKTLLTALVIAASVTVSVAQEKQINSNKNNTPVVNVADEKSPEVKAQEWHNLLVTELKLTEEQSKKISEMSKAFADRAAGMEKMDLTEDVKKERRAMLKKAQETQIAKFLTPEQQTKYQALLEGKKA